MPESSVSDYFDDELRKLNEGLLPPAPDRVEQALSRPELKLAVAACYSSGGGLYWEKYSDFCEELKAHGFNQEETDQIFSRLRSER